MSGDAARKSACATTGNTSYGRITESPHAYAWRFNESSPRWVSITMSQLAAKRRRTFTRRRSCREFLGGSMPRANQRPNLAIFLVIAVLGLPAPGFSQWLHYPTDGVPRKADGTPNLAAPAPRLADGKPDFSGIWHAARRNPCTPEAGRFIPCGIEIGGSPLARNLGVDLPGGPPYQPWAAEIVKQRTAVDSIDDPHVRCLPDNPPRPWGMPYLTKAVHTPKLLVLLYEVNAMY